MKAPLTRNNAHTAALLTLAVTAALFAPNASASDGKPRLDPNRNEYSLIPATTYNRDDGLGLGLLGVWARFKDDYTPYKMRAELLTFYNLRENDSGIVKMPSQAHWVLVDFPGLLGPRVRVFFQFGYAHLNRYYYGIGNNTSVGVNDRKHYQYERYGPPIELKIRIQLSNNFYFVGTSQFVHNNIRIYDGSKLEEDLGDKGDPFTRKQLFGTTSHNLLLFKLGLQWDTRDHEVVPQNGMNHEIQAHTGMGLNSEFVYSALQLTARFFKSIAGKYLVAAARVSSDLYFGEPPFYALPAIGSPWSVRGVPAGQFRGKVRLLGNVELRSRFIQWSIGSHRFHLGLAGFVDTGRVWTGYSPNTELDGTGHGLKLGLGGGPRFQWGETVILRFDGAWSPSGTGFYIDVSHTF